jgi:hypothetical protein
MPVLAVLYRTSTAHTWPTKSSLHGSEGPRGRTRPSDAAVIRSCPDPDWEKRDRQCGGNGEAVLAQRGESDVCHHLNAGVGLTTNDGP